LIPPRFLTPSFVTLAKFVRTGHIPHIVDIAPKGELFSVRKKRVEKEIEMGRMPSIDRAKGSGNRKLSEGHLPSIMEGCLLLGRRPKVDHHRDPEFPCP
jgi:hypothetical protein